MILKMQKMIHHCHVIMQLVNATSPSVTATEIDFIVFVLTTAEEHVFIVALSEWLMHLLLVIID